MVKQDVLLDLLPEGGWIDLHKPRLTPLKNEELTLYQRFLLFLMLKGVLGILPPYIAKTSEAPVCRGL